MPAARWGLVTAIALAASVTLFAATIQLGLLSDDYVLLWLPVLPGARWPFRRPLPMLVWKAVYPFAGAAGLHVLNVLLHGVNTALVFRLAGRLAPDAPRVVGALAALTFMTSPVAVEPIAWASGIFDIALVTCALGYLLTLLASWGRAWTAAAAVAWLAAALATKETAVALPILGAVLALRARIPWPALAASVAIAGGYAAVRAVGLGLSVAIVSEHYRLDGVAVESFGALGRPWLLAAAPAAARIAVLLGYALLVVGYAWGRGDWRRLSTAAWVAAGASPVLDFAVAADLSGSRYLYLPLVGWSLVLADLAWRQSAGLPRRLAVGFVVAMAAAGLVAGQQRVRVWTQAAAVRDRVVAEARTVLRTSPCPRVILLGAPDSLDGAYVFRNGLPLATGDGSATRIRTVPEAGVGEACTFVWRDDRFVPAGAPPGR